MSHCENNFNGRSTGTGIFDVQFQTVLKLDVDCELSAVGVRAFKRKTSFKRLVKNPR
jgi:hypothetical protein